MRGLRVPDVSGMTLEEAAHAYGAAGWYGGPLLGKHPGSLLGRGWHTRTVRSGPDVAATLEDHGGRATGWFLHVGRSGAVVFDLDHPQLAPPELAGALFACNPPQQTTRADGSRRHALFRQPDGPEGQARLIGNGKGALAGPWGDVRGLNGVIVVAPSLHPDADAGGAYRWLSVGEVPAMPPELAAMLPDGSPGLDAADDRTVAAALAAWDGNEAPWARWSALNVWQQGMALGEARHDVAVRAACMVARDARARLYPLRGAVAVLREAFVEALSVPAGGGRVVNAPRAHAEFSGILAWAVAQALGESGEEIQKRRGRALDAADRYRSSNVAPTTELGTLGLDLGLASQPQQQQQGMAAVIPLFRETERDEPDYESVLPPDCRLPESFWNARGVLAQIRDAARSRRVGPDVALGTVLARQAAMIPPWVRIDVGRGPTGLHLFVAMVGPSGAGKSLGAELAIDLLPTPPSLLSDDEHGRDPFRDGVPIGSGEGIPETFMGTVVREEVNADGKTRLVRERRVVRHHALFAIDEGQALLRMIDRAGSTLGTTLRTAWSGGTLGQANATAETRRLVPRGAYSVGMVVGFQPAVVAPLFGASEAGGGTTQRLLFLPVDDPGATVEHRPAWPGPLNAAYGLLSAWHAPSAPVLPPIDPGTPLAPPGAVPPRLLAVDPRVVQHLDVEAVAGLTRRAPAGTDQGEADLDKHANLQRLRIAAHLGVLEGREAVSWGDWQLACEVWAASCRVRSWLRACVEGEARATAEGRRRERVTTAVLEDDAKVARAQQRDAARVQQQARRLARKVHELGGCRVGALRALLGKAALRELLPEILDEMTARGWVTVHESDTRVGQRVEPAGPVTES